MPSDRVERRQLMRRELARCFAENAALRRMLRNASAAPRRASKSVWMRFEPAAALARTIVRLARSIGIIRSRSSVERLLRASGTFDAGWYLAQYRDVARAGADPLRHYVRHGAAEGRWPNEYFSPEWYADQCPNVAALGLNPLLHYLTRGAARALSPHPEVPPPDFLLAHPEASNYATILHYLLEAGLPRLSRLAVPGASGNRAPIVEFPAHAPVIGRAPGAGRRVCAFAHFDADGRIRPHVRFYLDAIAGRGFEIHLISTSPHLAAADRTAAESRGVSVHLRENTGRDFGSWQWGLLNVPEMRQADVLLLANDSVFGPLFDLAEAFAAMESQPLDYWGITDSASPRWHIQSYFLYLSRQALTSRAFKTVFSQDFAALAGKRRVVRRGEILLSQALRAEGLIGRAYCPEDRISPARNMAARLNPMHFSWDALVIEQRCPFLKLELLRDNPEGIGSVAHWRALVEGFTDYDSALIDAHIGGRAASGGGQISLAAG